MTTTTIKERPLIMSSDSVRAILAGTKTQTRRVVLPANSTVLGGPGKRLWSHLLWTDGVWVDSGPDPFGGSGYQYLHVPARNPADGPPADDGLNVTYRVRPIWEPEDQLWVRETWTDTLCDHHDGRPICRFKADDGRGPVIGERWRSPLHMPRVASRLSLPVTRVKVERVQDISEADAEAEGIDFVRSSSRVRVSGQESRRPTAVESYRWLWDVINGKRAGCTWADNPWCWCLSFRAVTPAAPPGTHAVAASPPDAGSTGR